MGITTTLSTVRAEARLGFVDVTEELIAAIERAELADGCAVAFCTHTTCALILNEWEDGALEDIRRRVEALAPAEVYYAHDDLERRTQNLAPEGERRNGSAHVAQMLLGGSSHAIPIIDGRPALGRWQRLFLFELDEPKDRSVIFHCFGSASTQSLVTKSQKASPAYLP